MTDQELLLRFESATLGKGEFSHRDHVRVAWLYLKDRPLLEILDEFPRRLRHLAATLGADGLYHETVTWFYLLLVHDRIVAGGARSCWEAFAAENPDLFERSSDVMNRFYDADTWQSDVAKRCFVLPDRLGA